MSGNVAGVDFFLPPVDDLIVNGQFEAGNLSGWSSSGSGMIMITDTVHTGDFAAALGNTDGSQAWSGTLSQSVFVPTALDSPTLALAYRIVGNSTLLQSNPASVRVQGASETVNHDLPISEGVWLHAWLDLDAFRGHIVTVAVEIDSPSGGVGWLAVDEVSLGADAPGIRQIYIPVVLRRE
jgi:hypothetical protein